MIDINKVIKGLEVCTHRPCSCKGCPYSKECVLDSQQLMEDALVLLKNKMKYRIISDHGTYTESYGYYKTAREALNQLRDLNIEDPDVRHYIETV